MHIGGQEHFYLEGQIALAVPGEDGAILVYSSTQHPSEVQHIVARVLAVPDCVRDLPRAPHGRRLRRQGNAGDAMGGDRRAGGAHDRPAVQVPARSRRRHGHDRQAARFRGRILGRLRSRRPHPRARPRSRCALRLFGRSSASAWSIAPCSTPTTPISCPNSKS